MKQREDYLGYAFAELAPRPKRLAETGLSRSFLADLTAKHLLAGGVLTISDLSRRLALSGGIVEDVVLFMRQEAHVEVLAAMENDAGLRHKLTDRGRVRAMDATSRSGYVGPAPISLERYAALVAAQSVHDQTVTREAMTAAYRDVVLKDSLLHQLGPALNSGRAIFIYGPAGTGKTFVTQRVARLFGDEVLIPHAIAIGDIVVPIFDPILHKIGDGDGNRGVVLAEGHDPRLVRAKRPVVIVGGELSIDMLEMRFDPLDRTHQAPLQLKANNGIFIIDDMGRQRAAPVEVFNRWIIPLEEKRDYLNLGAGRHFSVPFDVILVFSTNMHPLELADEAFLRRIGHKIEFETLDRESYCRIWRMECEQRDIRCDDQVLAFTMDELHARNGIPLLPCHPRDLASIVVERARYEGLPRQLTKDSMRDAWKSYFVSLSPGATPDSSESSARRSRHDEA